jgi:cyclase
MNEEISFSSRHFKLEKLADGVYAALHVNGGGALSNAGIIDLGDRTLVFDSMGTPAAGSDLAHAAQALTGRPAGLLVNSHHHNDHTWGNQAFGSQAEIISTEKTRQKIADDGPHERVTMRESAPEYLAQYEKDARSLPAGVEQRTAVLWAGYYRALIEAIPTLKICVPTLTFSGKLTIYGSTRQVDLLVYADGHTSSDCILVLPAEEIAFTGDLLSIGCHPYIVEGNCDAAIRNLQEMRKLDLALLVPGHGDVGVPADIDVNIGYLSKVHELGAATAAARLAEDTLASLAIPAEYAEWTIPEYFQMNLVEEYRRMKMGPGKA